MINRAQAIVDILTVFSAYKSRISASDRRLVRQLTNGKLYELYVLSEVVTGLVSRGCHLKFLGSSLAFKGSPGMLKASDPHFEVTTPNGDDLWLFVDIEFETLGHFHSHIHSSGAGHDDSRRHELDIILVGKNSGYPTHQDIWLGVECKSTAKFTKKIIKEALGIRRELSFLASHQISKLSSGGAMSPIFVPADPASEFHLAFIDPKGLSYAISPSSFGITLRHLAP